MKSIFDNSTKDELISRVNSLKENSTALWGRMRVAQMLAHCTAFQEAGLGNITQKRSWLGFIIGRFVKALFYSDEPLPKNMSTLSSIIISGEVNFETEKQILKERIIMLQDSGQGNCAPPPHPFFGSFTPEQWGKGFYKHLDHHLRQFGA